MTVLSHESHASHQTYGWPRRIVTALLLVAFVVTLGSPVLSSSTVNASGTIPAGLPEHFFLGLDNQPTNLSWMTDSGIPWDARYKYLVGGVNTGSGWATWNANGDFATYYMRDSANAGYMPVFTYYQLLQSLPGTGSSEAERNYTNLNNASTMRAYYADFKLLLDKVRAFGKPVIIHVEPDLFGFMQHRVLSSTNSAASIPAAVAASGYADAAGLPDTFQGFNWALLRLRDRYAPNALLATHISGWSGGVDIGSDSSTSLDVARLAQKVAAFHQTAGIAGNPSDISSYDLLFFDPLDRDAAFYELVYRDGGARWWDETNATFPNFARYHAFITGVTGGVNRRAVLWQVPIGNTKVRSMNNTDGHYQDNRVQYWLGGYPQDGNLEALADAGVIGILFGMGAGGVTSYVDAKRDGITNPAPINGNDVVAAYADDDGGYLRMAAANYYQRGVYRFDSSPVATTSTPTQTATKTPVPTATSISGSFVAVPGRFEAEDYRDGGQGVGYYDVSAGNAGGAYRTDDVDIEPCFEGSPCYDVGYIEVGDWLAYDVDVTSSGSYVFSARAASPNTDKRFHIEVDGVNVSGSIVVPQTGAWQTWQDVASPAITMSAGKHVIKLVSETGGFNLNYVTVDRASSTSEPTQTPVPTATKTPAPTATSTPVPTATAASVAMTFAVAAAADGYVRERDTNGNYGLSTKLGSDGNSVEQTYIRFNTGAFGGSVESAKLRVYVYDGTTKANGSVRQVSNTTWGETTLTYANRPAMDGMQAGSYNNVASGSWVEFDVTAVVKEPGVYSFGISQTGADDMNFASREYGTANLRPQLVVTTK